MGGGIPAKVVRKMQIVPRYVPLAKIVYYPTVTSATRHHNLMQEAQTGVGAKEQLLMDSESCFRNACCGRGTDSKVCGKPKTRRRRHESKKKLRAVPKRL